MNIEHHQEQMEAARKEFAAVWERTLKPVALGLLRDKYTPLVRDVCWAAWRDGMFPINKPT